MRKVPASGEKGQLSIFLGISLLVVITLLGFVINVGLFVKAKINLQNAVDAAAWSGAATQARQLTNIGYVNWEMRNTYKEWMFKYYVLGQMGLSATSASGLAASGDDWVNFRTIPFYQPGDTGTSGNSLHDPSVVDNFNVPSTCIHFGTEHDICQIYDVPGVPRFETVGLPGISEQHETFLNTLATTKSKDCSARSDINLSNAIMWAYGTKVDFTAGNVPLIAPQRTGAWIQAIELALRMRNLEMIVNRPPVNGICFNSGEAAGACQNTVLELDTESNVLPLNERPIKAFWSAFRNLAGGDIKEETPEVVSDLAKSFTLTELAPTPFEAEPRSVSGFLIPSDATIGQSGISALQKHYLDLQVFPLNFVSFYTTFVSNTSTFRDGNDVSSEGDCGATKTGLPVPAYPFGYTKNPEVLTYYAVKGQAKFVGMFYPFADPDGIDMFAYAAAKPFGGRIGPRLFDFEGGNLVRGRNDAAQFRSAPYISGFNVSTLPGGSSTFKPGFPIPIDESFWVRDSRPIGGVPGAASTVHFGIPNLIYDYTSFTDIDPLQTNASKPVLELTAATNYTQGYVSRPPNENIKGLYAKNQFIPFQANLGTATGTILDASTIDNAIEKVRGPTRYEALNYMVPTFENDPTTLGPESPDAAPAVTPVDNFGRPDGISHIYNLFAPLFGTDTLYPELSSVNNIVNDYISANDPAIQVFLDALKDVADSMRDQSSSAAVDPQTYIAAANSIHPPNNNLSVSGAADCPGISMASKFHQLFRGNSTECNITPLREMVTKYINTENADPFQNGDGLSYALYYQSTYRLKPDSPTVREFMTAYSPGERQGAQPDGTMPHPFGVGDSISGKRNFYSTKFFALEKVEANASASYTNPATYQEAPNSSPPDMLTGAIMKNPLQPNQLDPFPAPVH